MDAGAAVWRVVLYPGVSCKVRAAALQWTLVLRLFLNLVVLRSEVGDELMGFVLVRFGICAGASDLVKACTGACRRPVVAVAQVLRSSPLFELMLAFFVLLLLWIEVDGCAEAWGAPDREVRRLLFFQRRSFAAFQFLVRSSIWGTVDGGWLLRCAELRAAGRRLLGATLTKNSSASSRDLLVFVLSYEVLSAKKGCNVPSLSF